MMLAVMCIMGLFTACGNAEDTIDEGGEKASDEKPEKMVILMSSEGTAPMEHAVKTFEEETGIKIELISEAYDNITKL